MAGVRRIADLGTQGIKTILDGSVQTADIANNAVTQRQIIYLFVWNYRNNFYQQGNCYTFTI